MAINIVLFEPEIPPNTGNIARTCALTGSKLHLIEPLGFSIEDKQLKRAGLDYWHLLGVEIHKNINDFFEKYPDGKYFFSTTKTEQHYTDVKYTDDCFIIFGKETAGLPNEIHEHYPERRIKIPMLDHKDVRSLNLSNAVAIVAYEALRQLEFPFLK